MIAALIIVLREVIEAGLIIGIILAATRQIPGRMVYIVGGIAGGLIGSGLLAFFAGALADMLEGMGQEIFNASILIIAVAMLTWHNVWMARHGRAMGEEIQKFGHAVREGSQTLSALAIVIGIAVLREGSEVVLFLYGVLASKGASGLQVFLGGLGGLALGIALSLFTYSGLVIIPLKHLFRVTSLLLAFMAAGMAAQAVAFLEQADLLTALTKTAWNTSAYLSETSLGGKVLHALLGYTDRPSQMQVLIYLLTLGVTFLFMKLLAPPPRTDRRLVTP
ncbi:FTR1 family iron permease [Beijerinckia indica]|uniref:Iron permease FTR1 n=1 Tax=Beijerinckia indica subsp. indica (strain ATCC 9039 / DSM 1715 / NCIMB 8712) TaxID=395963 RepID=B2IBP4_BEII9|nr:FTR1 family protein [Beijerinckia indica]ACB93766.1 iron permease FTR1 [Beijerinckia indica subsp. indica ATCC 9039]